LASTTHDKTVLNAEFVPKTDVLDANDAFNFTYSLNLPAFFPGVV